MCWISVCVGCEIVMVWTVSVGWTDVEKVGWVVAAAKWDVIVDRVSVVGWLSVCCEVVNDWIAVVTGCNVVVVRVLFVSWGVVVTVVWLVVGVVVIEGLVEVVASSVGFTVVYFKVNNWGKQLRNYISLNYSLHKNSI